MKIVFETTRLKIRTAEPADAEFYYELWTNPRVMTFVGFPRGLRITQLEIETQLAQECEEGDVLASHLLAELKTTSERIGECQLGVPDEHGLVETDIKLMPQFWGQKYGVEIKQGLLDYLFKNTDCQIVQATPNVHNPASIAMQEAVGGVRVGENYYIPPEDLRNWALPVHAYVYHVTREDWEARHIPPIE